MLEQAHRGLQAGRGERGKIMEVCAIAVMMGGGPFLPLMAEVELAMNEF